MLTHLTVKQDTALTVLQLFTSYGSNKYRLMSVIISTELCKGFTKQSVVNFLL